MKNSLLRAELAYKAVIQEIDTVHMHVVIDCLHKFLIPQKQRPTMSIQREVTSALHTIIKREIQSARSTLGMPRHIMSVH